MEQVFSAIFPEMLNDPAWIANVSFEYKEHMRSFNFRLSNKKLKTPTCVLPALLQTVPVFHTAEKRTAGHDTNLC